MSLPSGLITTEGGNTQEVVAQKLGVQPSSSAEAAPGALFRAIPPVVPAISVIAKPYLTCEELLALRPQMEEAYGLSDAFFQRLELINSAIQAIYAVVERPERMDEIMMLRGLGDYLCDIFRSISANPMLMDQIPSGESFFKLLPSVIDNANNVNVCFLVNFVNSFYTHKIPVIPVYLPNSIRDPFANIGLISVVTSSPPVNNVNSVNIDNLVVHSNAVSISNSNDDNCVDMAESSANVSNCSHNNNQTTECETVRETQAKIGPLEGPFLSDKEVFEAEYPALPPSVCNTTELMDAPGSSATIKRPRNDEDSGPETENGGFIEVSGRKAAKRVNMVPMGTEIITTANKFAAITPTEAEMAQSENTDEALTAAQQSKEPRPEPLFLKMDDRWRDTIAAINTLLGEEVKKKISGDLVKVIPRDIAQYRAIQKMLCEAKCQFFAMQPKPDRPRRVLIKGIPNDTPIQEVKDELLAMNFQVGRVTVLKHNKTKKFLNMYICDIFLNENFKRIFEVRKFLGYMVGVVPYVFRGVKQCFNCQKYNHSSLNCSMAPACVKCGNEHQAHECTIGDDATLIKCCNCGGNHTANYRGCPRNPANIAAARKKIETVKTAAAAARNAKRGNATINAANASQTQASAGKSTTMAPADAIPNKTHIKSAHKSNQHNPTKHVHAAKTIAPKGAAHSTFAAATKHNLTLRTAPTAITQPNVAKIATVTAPTKVVQQAHPTQISESDICNMDAYINRLKEIVNLLEQIDRLTTKMQIPAISVFNNFVQSPSAQAINSNTQP